MEKKTGYDAVVFDMDGVIFDSERAVMQCWKELADNRGTAVLSAVLLLFLRRKTAVPMAGSIWNHQTEQNDFRYF